MKKLSTYVGLVVLAGAMGAGMAEDKPVTREHTEKLSATVVSVDHDTRGLVLKGDSGQTAEFVAGPEVRNFEQIKAGDHVVLRYKIGVAAQLLPSGTKAADVAVGKPSMQRAEPGAKPGGAVAQSASAIVTIESVDKSFNTVTFKRADGITSTVAVESPEGQKFMHKLKPGDAVQITYSEAVALNVEDASASK